MNRFIPLSQSTCMIVIMGYFIMILTVQFLYILFAQDNNMFVYYSGINVYNIILIVCICYKCTCTWGQNQNGRGAKSDHGAKTVYVYLLTYSILYKNTAYLGGGQNDVFARTIYYWVGNRPLPPPPHHRRPCY